MRIKLPRWAFRLWRFLDLLPVAWDLSSYGQTGTRQERRQSVRKLAERLNRGLPSLSGGSRPQARKRRSGKARPLCSVRSSVIQTTQEAGDGKEDLDTAK
jgi:hypothetical protein